MKQDLGHLSTSGPDRRQVWATALPDALLAQLLDLDLRIKNLPEGKAKDSTKEWLDDIGWALASGSLMPGMDLGREEAGSRPIAARGDRVTSAELDYGNFGLPTRLRCLRGAASGATHRTDRALHTQDRWSERECERDRRRRHH